MKFRTILDSPPSATKITYDSSICMLGSCFSDSIGGKLLRSKLNVLKNPFGTLYHPSAIKKNLLDNDILSDQGIVKVDNRYVHYDAHSDIHATSEDKLIQLLEEQRKKTKEYISGCDFVFITLGTAWHFYHNGLDRIVSNCHKQPSQLFDRRLSSVTEVIDDLEALVGHIKEENAYANVILTVSPVRHIRDGLIENNRSKGHLLAAVHEISNLHDHVQYFPSYELVIDDLRDYRFFKNDMIHPSEQAIDYVFDYLKQTFMDEQTIDIMAKVQKIVKSVEHKPIDPDSSQHQSFLVNLKSSIEALTKNHPMDFSKELEAINHQLA